MFCGSRCVTMRVTLANRLKAALRRRGQTGFNDVILFRVPSWVPAAGQCIVSRWPAFFSRSAVVNATVTGFTARTICCARPRAGPFPCHTIRRRFAYGLQTPA